VQYRYGKRWIAEDKIVGMAALKLAVFLDGFAVAKGA
jgi:hypothetical protein